MSNRDAFNEQWGVQVRLYEQIDFAPAAMERVRYGARIYVANAPPHPFAGHVFVMRPTGTGTRVWVDETAASGPPTGPAGGDLASPTPAEDYPDPWVHNLHVGGMDNVQGDTLYRGAAVWETLAAGLLGQHEVSGGAGANPFREYSAGTYDLFWSPVGGSDTANGTTALTPLLTLGEVLKRVNGRGYAGFSRVKLLTSGNLGALSRTAGPFVQIPGGGSFGGSPVVIYADLVDSGLGPVVLTGGTVGVATGTPVFATLTTGLVMVADAHKKRYFRFSPTTTTIALRNRLCLIEANSVGGVLTIVDFLPAVPVNGDAGAIVEQLKLQYTDTINLEPGAGTVLAFQAIWFQGQGTVAPPTTDRVQVQNGSSVFFDACRFDSSAAVMAVSSDVLSRAVFGGVNWTRAVPSTVLQPLLGDGISAAGSSLMSMNASVTATKLGELEFNRCLLGDGILTADGGHVLVNSCAYEKTVGVVASTGLRALSNGSLELTSTRVDGKTLPFINPPIDVVGKSRVTLSSVNLQQNSGGNCIKLSKQSQGTIANLNGDNPNVSALAAVQIQDNSQATIDVPTTTITSTGKQLQLAATGPVMFASLTAAGTLQATPDGSTATNGT